MVRRKLGRRNSTAEPHSVESLVGLRGSRAGKNSLEKVVCSYRKDQEGEGTKMHCPLRRKRQKASLPLQRDPHLCKQILQKSAPLQKDPHPANDPRIFFPSRENWRVPFGLQKSFHSGDPSRARLTRCGYPLERCSLALSETSTLLRNIRCFLSKGRFR